MKIPYVDGEIGVLEIAIVLITTAIFGLLIALAVVG